jgi:hypothetical protein
MICGVVSLLALLSSANAAVLTFQLSGNVTQVPLDDVFGDIAVGETIHGSYTFDTSAADLAPADSATGIFTWGAPFGMTVTIGTHDFTTSGLLNVGILNSFVDQYTVLGLSAASDVTLELFLQDHTGGVFANDQLPLTAPSLAGFGQKDFHLHAMLAGGEIQVDGQLSTLASQAVPEPHPAGLVLVGSIILLVLARRTHAFKFN